MNIQLTFTGNKKKYPNPYYSPYIVTADKELPKMYNAGYNSYNFIGGEPVFSCDIPDEVLTVKLEGKDYIYYNSIYIEVERKDGTTCGGTFYRRKVKETGENVDGFNFS